MKGRSDEQTPTLSAHAPTIPPTTDTNGHIARVQLLHPQAENTSSLTKLNAMKMNVYGQRVVDGRRSRYISDAQRDPTAAALLDQLPFSIGTHISTPIVLKSGEVYGTLCCFSFSPQEDPKPDDLRTLEMTAKLTAMRLEGRGVRPAPAETPAWTLAQN